MENPPKKFKKTKTDKFLSSEEIDENSDDEKVLKMSKA